jgi:hypothetical protein
MLYRILFFGMLVFFFFWGTSRGDTTASQPKLAITAE